MIVSVRKKKVLAAAAAAMFCSWTKAAGFEFFVIAGRMRCSRIGLALPRIGMADSGRTENAYSLNQTNKNDILSNWSGIWDG